MTRAVFLSYSRADAEIMRRVRDALRDEGLVVWTDESLEPGTPSWKAAIEGAIETAACLVVLLSPEAKKSEWVGRELGYADAHNIAIFPVLVRGDERDAVPLLLINTQRIDVRSRFLAGMQTLVDALREHYRRLEPADDPTAVDPVVWLNRGDLYLRFWRSLLDRSRGHTELFANEHPADTYYLTTASGRPSVTLGYIIAAAADWASVEVFINSNSAERNKRLFDALLAERTAIETEVGDALDWLRLNNKRGSKIVWRCENAGILKTEAWPALQDRLIETMIRVDRAFRPRLQTLPFD